MTVSKVKYQLINKVQFNSQGKRILKMQEFKWHVYLSRIATHAVLLLLLLFVLCNVHGQTIPFSDSVSVFVSKNNPGHVIKELSISALHFSKVTDNRINFGLAGSDYHYIFLKLISRYSENEKYISIDNTSLDTVFIFELDEDGAAHLIYSGGQLIPFESSRRYVWHEVAVQIGSVPSYYLIALKAAQKNINVRYEILSSENLGKKYQDHDRIIFFYIGVVCLIIIIIILALFLFKKPVFAAYMGYIVFTFTWIISHYGYIFPYVFPRVPVLNEIVKPISSLSAAFFLLNVLNLVFRKQLQSSPKLQRLINATLFMLPWLIASMFLLLIPGLHYLVKGILLTAWHAGLLFTIATIVFVPLGFIHSGATAKIFSVAMFVICTMSIVQLFANSGYVNNFFVEEHGITMGSLLENVIIAFGLFYNLIKERRQSEMQLLTLQREQADTLKMLVTVQDNERKRIAGDLHDNIGPLLAALKINFRRIVNTKERSQLNGLAAKTESIIDDSIAEIHNVALNLMPKGLSSNGLINTLHEYFESIQQLYNKEIVFRHQVDSILNPELQINLYRVICELVLNSARHSNALNITVCINANATCVALEIHDDGKGFQLKPGENKNALGLQNAESRVLYLKGKFDIFSEAGKGTHINIEIPL